MDALKTCRARVDRQRILVLAVILTLTLATSLLFIVAPQIDARFSAWFYDGTVFPAAGNVHLQILRRANEVIGGIVLVAATLLLCSAGLRRRTSSHRRRAAADPDLRTRSWVARQRDFQGIFRPRPAT